MDFEDAIEKANAYLAGYNPKSVVKVIKHDCSLFDYISKNSKGESFSEKIYNLVSGNPAPEMICEKGNRRRFISLVDGYAKGCDRNCHCTRQSRSKSVSLSKKKATAEQIAAANNKRRQTILAASGGKYCNNGQSPKAKENHKKFYSDPVKVRAITEKQRKDCQEQYGVDWHAKRPEVRKRIKRTCAERHGFENPMQNKEIAKRSSQERRKNRSPEDIQANFPRFKQRLKEKFHIEILLEQKDFVGVTDKRYHNFRCLECGNQFTKRIHYGEHLTCRVCHPVIKTFMSNEERAVKDLASSFTDSIVRQSDKSTINPYEIDIVFPELGIAIDYGGLYWHSEVSREKRPLYHMHKTNRAMRKGYRLLTIFSDEWKLNKRMVEHQLKVILSKNEIDATKCVIEEMDTDFVNEVHSDYNPNGAAQDRGISFGIYHGGDLVSVLTVVDGIVERKTDFTRLNGVYQNFAAEIKNHLGLEKLTVIGDRRWESPPKGVESIRFKKPLPYCVESYENRLLMEEVTGNNYTHIDEVVAMGYDRIWDCGWFEYDL